MYTTSSRVVTVFTPNNAKKELTRLNKEYMSRKYKGKDGYNKTYTIQQMINKRIEECGIKVRKGQSRSLEVIFGGSPEILNGLTPQQVDQWAKDTIEWAKTNGAKRMSCMQHYIWTNQPHIYM